jgi:hypothetical protein
MLLGLLSAFVFRRLMVPDSTSDSRTSDTVPLSNKVAGNAANDRSADATFR